MAKPSFRCEKCKRTFKLAAHLARHNSAIHGVAPAAKSTTKAKRKKAGRGPGRPKGSGKKKGRRVAASVSAVRSVGDGASGILLDMQSYLSNLAAQRLSLDAEIDAMASAMKLLGDKSPSGGSRKTPGPAPRKKGRPVGSGGRRGSLKKFIVRVLSQHTKPLSPQDIGTRVVKAGFKTKAKNLTKAISNTLPTIDNVKKVGFGQYQLGGG